MVFFCKWWAKWLPGASSLHYPFKSFSLSIRTPREGKNSNWLNGGHMPRTLAIGWDWQLQMKNVCYSPSCFLLKSQQSSQRFENQELISGFWWKPLSPEETLTEGLEWIPWDPHWSQECNTQCRKVQRLIGHDSPLSIQCRISCQANIQSLTDVS